MSASLMALIQASLLQDRASDAEGLSKVSYPVEPVLVKREAASRAGNTAECMQQLVAAMTKLFEVDQMLEQVQQAVPADDGAAQKWYQVSLTSLQWTRKAQADRVHAMLQELKSAMLALQAPTSISEDLSMIQEEAICDVPPGFEAPTNIVEDFSMMQEEAICAVPPGFEAPTRIPEDGGEDAPKKCLQGLEKVGSLRNDLEAIKKRDPDCCLMVRNIKRLGLESAEALRAHFGRFGEVTDVYCAHSLEKPSAKRRHGRIRPAALGFVVMAAKEGAEQVLAAGSDQTVGDVCVNVRRFDGEPQDTE